MKASKTTHDFHHDQNGQTTEDQLLEKECSASENKSRTFYTQGIVMGTIILYAAGVGMPIGYSAILLPQLQVVNSSMRADENMGSWIASLHSAATPVGSLLSGMLLDRFGRKLTLQMTTIPLVSGWLFIALARSHVHILIGRVVAGIAVGAAGPACQIFIGEISEPRFRGVFGSFPLSSYCFGILLVYALGSTLHWQLVAGIGTLLPTMSLLAMLFLPESPVWLVKKGRLEQAKKALVWLRDKDYALAKQELQQLISRTESESIKHQHTSKSLFSTFSQPQVLKPFVILNVFNILQIFSGTYLIVFYAVDIISHTGGQNMDNFLAAVLTACVRFIFTVVACVLLGMIGRRKLALSSGLGSTVSALCLGTFLFLEKSDCQTSGYFAALCVLLYVAANNIGFMILPGVLLGELYPARVRGLAGGVTFAIFNFVLFAVAKLFPNLQAGVGIHGIFWIFGISSLLLSVFLYVMLPETRGTTLIQIEDYFLQKNICWLSRNREKRQDDNHNTTDV